jgi:hypothetical protein
MPSQSVLFGLSRKCTKCGTIHPLDEEHFRRDPRYAKGFKTWCNDCTNDLTRRGMNKRYATDEKFRERVKRRVREWRKAHPEKRRKGDSKRRALAKAFVQEYLRSHPCIDCGESDPVALDFDHRNQKAKRYCIGAGIAGGILPESLLKEMEKCDIRCSNCHRKKHAREHTQGKRVHA